MADAKWSQFQSVTPDNADELVGLHNGNNARFSFANVLVWLRQNLASFFVPASRTVNNKALSSDIALSASDVGAVPSTYVGAAGGVASLGVDGKVPTSQLPPISAEGKANETTIAPVEASTTASEAHALGHIFYLEGVLYRALSDIAIGGTINVGSGGNATQTTIAENFSRIVKLTSAQYAQLSAAEKAADIIYIVTDDPVPSPSDSTPQDLGTAAAGSSGNYSRADHVHQKPTYSKSDVGLGNVANVLQYSANNPPPYPVTSVNGSTGAVTVSVPSAYTSNPAMDGTASPGSSGSWAKGDHVHPSDTSKANETELAYVESGSTASRAYSIGEYFCWGGSLYRAKTAISSGASFTVGTNCESVPGGGLNDINSTAMYDISFNSGYSVISGETAQYSKTKNGIVTVFGCIRHGKTDITPFEPFTLPEGYRPKYTVRFLAHNSNHGYVVMGSIGPDGAAVFLSMANAFATGATFNTGLAFRDLYFEVCYRAAN